jgi:transposase-like protein
VRKGQRRLDGLTGNVISLYAKGLTTGDIQAHLAEIYGTEVSRDTISRITDTIALASSTLVRQRLRSRSSTCMRLQNDSITALS